MYKSFKDNRLLPCPFCGEDAEIGWYRETAKKERFYVGCSRENCCEIESIFYDIDKCIAAWNTRKLVKENGQWTIEN